MRFFCWRSLSDGCAIGCDALLARASSLVPDPCDRGSKELDGKLEMPGAALRQDEHELAAKSKKPAGLFGLLASVLHDASSQQEQALCTPRWCALGNCRVITVHHYDRCSRAESAARAPALFWHRIAQMVQHC